MNATGIVSLVCLVGASPSMRRLAERPAPLRTSVAFPGRWTTDRSNEVGGDARFSP